jgi:hypothetical protein
MGKFYFIVFHCSSSEFFWRSGKGCHLFRNWFFWVEFTDEFLLRSTFSNWIHWFESLSLSRNMTNLPTDLVSLSYHNPHKNPFPSRKSTQKKLYKVVKFSQIDFSKFNLDSVDIFHKKYFFYNHEILSTKFNFWEFSFYKFPFSYLLTLSFFLFGKLVFPNQIINF